MANDKLREELADWALESVVYMGDESCAYTIADQILALVQKHDNEYLRGYEQAKKDAKMAIQQDLDWSYTKTIQAQYVINKLPERDQIND